MFVKSEFSSKFQRLGENQALAGVRKAGLAASLETQVPCSTKSSWANLDACSQGLACLI